MARRGRFLPAHIRLKYITKKPRAKPRYLEGAIQEKIVELLQMFGRQDICWWACPNGDYRNPRVGERLRRQGVKQGASDLMLMIDHIFHALELKSDIGEQQTTQKLWGAELEMAGGVYHIAYGIEEAINVLTDIGAFKPGIDLTNKKHLQPTNILAGG